MCCLKAFAAWSIIIVCVFGESLSSDVCKPFPARDLPKLCGYNGTVMYEHLSHFDSAIRAVNYVSKLMGSCSPYANLIVCSAYIPRCESHIEGPYLPCRRVCDEFNDKCGDKLQKHGLEWIIGMCQLLPVEDDPKTTLGYLGRCFEPPNFKSNFTIESTTKALKCYPLVVPMCQNIGYEYTVLSTQKQKASIKYANRTLSALPKDNSTAACPLERKRFFCTENFPACIDQTVAFYCRQKCEDFFNNNCSSPFFYQREMCMEFPMGSSPVDICKQSHWPRAQNWPAVKEQSTMQSITTTANPKGSHSPSNKKRPPTGIYNPSRNTKSPAGSHSPSNKKRPPTGIYNPSRNTKSPAGSHSPSNKKRPPTGIYNPSTKSPAENSKAKARQDKKIAKSKTPKIVGGVLTAVFFIAVALLIAYVIYRKKREATIPYDKQILYNDETVDF